MSYRVKLAIFALGAVLVLFVVDTAYEGLDTLKRLDVIEAERDQWQRPADVIRALSLKQGDTVVDLGCGSGYFALKLSSAVGDSGSVYAVDIRRLSLVFLWLRSMIKKQHSVATVLATPDDPRLPSGRAHAVLMANTFHELENREAILNRIFDSLRPGARLVIVEPMQSERGELPPGAVEAELRRLGFDISSRDDQFINHPVAGRWWLIIASKASDIRKL